MSQVSLSYDNYKVEKNRGKNVSRRRTALKAQNCHFQSVITFEPRRILTCGLRKSCSIGPKEHDGIVLTAKITSEVSKKRGRKWAPLHRHI